MTSALTSTQIQALTPAIFAAEPISFFSSLTSSQASGVTAAQIKALSAAQIAAIPANAIAGLTTAVQLALTAADITAMTPQQIAGLASSVVASFSTTELQALSAAQMAALSAAQLAVLSSAQFAAFHATQIAALTAAQLGGLSQAQVQAITAANFSPSQVTAMTAALISKLSVAQFDVLLATNLSKLTASQIAGLTALQIQSLTSTEFKSLSSAQIANFSAAQISALTSAQIATLTPAEIGALTATQISGLTAQQLSGLATTQIAALTTTQLTDLSVQQISGLSGAELNGMTGAQLGALNPAGLSVAQIAALNAAAIASLSAKAFDALIVPHIASLSTQAVQGLTTAELASMTTAQLQSFTTGQIASMSAANAAIVRAALAANPVLADASTREVGGSLSFASLQAILQDADTGAMTATNFQGLKTLASELNVSGGISTTAYAQQMFDNVVLGNTADAWWNGGSNTTVALGALTATSSQTQLSELIGKWFLGADNPGVGSGAEGYATSYVAFTTPLWSGSGPSYKDINQGQVGDCYFVSALGELALQDPTAIENMIKQNSNGSYSVEFQVNGQADWVTVNNQLAEYGSGGRSGPVFANGEGTLWAPLIEKAYVELTEQIYGTKGANYNNIDGGNDNGLQAITGQSDNWDGFTAHESTSSLQSLLTQLQTAFNGKEEILFASQTNDSAANLVASHMFFVTGVNAAAGTVSLENPWGANGAGSGLQMSFTDTIATLAAQSGDGFYVTSGKPTLG